MRHVVTTCWLLSALLLSVGRADEYTVEVIDEPAPLDELTEEIAGQISAKGYRVVRDGKRTIWEIWPAKTWQVEAGFEPTVERLYAFRPGGLIAVANLRRRGSDFRDQDISRGVYTLRYAIQPVDGNHVGTSPTADFLLLVRAEDDHSADPMPSDQLKKASADAAGSSHPAMICLQKLRDGATPPALRLQDESGWWVLRLAGAKRKDATPLSIDVVVVGHATE